MIVPTSWQGLQADRCRQGLRSSGLREAYPWTDVEVGVGHIVACVGCRRSVVGPCFACSWRSRVAPAPEILCFAPLSIVMKQECACCSAELGAISKVESEILAGVLRIMKCSDAQVDTGQMSLPVHRGGAWSPSDV